MNCAGIIKPGGQISDGIRPLDERLEIFAGYCPKCGALMALMGKHGVYCPKCGPEEAAYNPSLELSLEV